MLKPDFIGIKILTDSDLNRSKSSNQKHIGLNNSSIINFVKNININKTFNGTLYSYNNSFEGVASIHKINRKNNQISFNLNDDNHPKSIYKEILKITYKSENKWILCWFIDMNKAFVSYLIKKNIL